MSNSDATSAARERLVSQLLLEDATLADIVFEFVNGLQKRIEELRAAHDAMNWAEMRTLAHRLKGAGGSYGYPDLSACAKALEEQLRAQDVSRCQAALAELERLAAAARAGLEGFTPA